MTLVDTPIGQWYDKYVLPLMSLIYSPMSMNCLAINVTTFNINLHKHIREVHLFAFINLVFFQ